MTTTARSVTPTRTGTVFQIGRPSGRVPYGVCRAHERGHVSVADHSARRQADDEHDAAGTPIPLERPVTALVRMSFAGPGVNDWRFVSSEFVADDPRSPTTETSAISAGKIESTP